MASLLGRGSAANCEHTVFCCRRSILDLPALDQSAPQATGVAIEVGRRQLKALTFSGPAPGLEIFSQLRKPGAPLAGLFSLFIARVPSPSSERQFDLGLAQAAATMGPPLPCCKITAKR